MLMKNILMMAMCLMALASCKQEKVAPALPQNSQVDSLSRIIEQKDNEINDMMELFNEVEEGFRLISEAENRVNLVRGLTRPSAYVRTSSSFSRGCRRTVN